MTVGLPSWTTLIEPVAEELDIDLSAFKNDKLNYLTLAGFYRILQGSIGLCAAGWIETGQETTMR
jgi:hypothetical protein